MGDDALKVEISMGFFSKLFSKSLPSKIEGSAQANANLDSDYALFDGYEALKRRGNALLDLGEFEDAELAYKAALQVRPQLCEAHINLGYVLSELSRAEDAKVCFDKAIQLDVQSFDAHFLSALLAFDQKDSDGALTALNRALKINPASEDAQLAWYKTLSSQGNFSGIEDSFKTFNTATPGQAEYHFGLSKVFSKISGSTQQREAALIFAVAESQKSLLIEPDNAELLHHLSLLYLSSSRTNEAMEILERAAGSAPAHFDSLFVLGNIYKTTGDLPNALDNLKKALTLKPESYESHKALGDVHYQSESFTTAVTCYKKALEIKPDMFEAWFMLGSSWCELEQYKLACECHDRVIALRPKMPEAYFGLGNLLFAQNKFYQAVDAYDTAISLQPNYTDALVNKGSALLGAGDHIQAGITFSRVLELKPDHLTARSNLVYCSSFDRTCGASDYLILARSWSALVSANALPYSDWKCIPRAGRPLKIGLVSGDLCLHPVGYFLENVAVHLDIEKIELHVFSNRVRDDLLQRNLKKLSSSWTSIVGVPDKAAAELVHDAGIDLLIDLAGHTNRNRLSLFAWCAAPVQASWLGYWASTGVGEIDYLLADRHAVPSQNQNQFSEQVWYLPHTRLCFTPPSKSYELPVSSPPSVKSGFITFGSFQPLRKLTPSVLALWGKVFSQVPSACFRLQGTGFTADTTRPDLLKRLAEVGIPPRSVILVESVARFDYFKAHSEVDILLDSFPYTGGTTTCDALWMGVPTVTLAGNNMLARQGVSIMTCAGLPDWIAQSEDEYVEIAVKKAGDPSLLALLRSQLRKSLFTSPLFNAPAFAKDLEVALAGMVEHKLGGGLGQKP